VLSGFGPGSDWLRNIQANGRAEVSIGRSSFPASYRVVPIEEAMAVFADYERRNRFAAPVVRLVLSRLLGWRYDGSESARRRVASGKTEVGHDLSRWLRHRNRPHDPRMLSVRVALRQGQYPHFS